MKRRRAFPGRRPVERRSAAAAGGPRRVRPSVLVSLCLPWLVVAAAAPAAPADFDFQVTTSDLPASVSTAATVPVGLEILNLGSRSWSSDDGFAVAYHWLDAGGRPALWDGLRTELDTPLGPGEWRRLVVAVRAPDRAGDYLLQWDVVQEGVRWLSEVDPTSADPLPVRVAPTHAFSLLEVDTPRVLLTGGRRSARMVLRNDGTLSWPGDGAVSVAIHWTTGDGKVVSWEGRRTAIDRTVVPGQAVVVVVPVDAPDVPGRMLLQWDMVDEGVCWFSERDDSPEPPVVVLVLPRSPLSPPVWAVLTLAGALAAAIRLRRRPTADVASWLGWADVLWFVAAVTVKQAWVLDEAGRGLAVAGWCLTAAGAAVIGLALLALPVRLRPWLVLAAAGLVTSLLFADLLHLRFFGDLGSVAALRSAGQLGRVGASVRSLLELRDLWFWADLPAAFGLVVVASRVPPADHPRRRPAAVLATVAALGLAAGSAALGRAEGVLRQVFRTTELARQIGVLNFHAADLGSGLWRTVARRRLDPDRVAELARYFEDRRPQRAGCGSAFAAAEGCNLVMLQVESLQAFVVGFRIGGREVTPFLNALAAEGFWFANVTDQTEQGRSSDSELATQTSLLPSSRGAAAFLYADNDFTGLASVLGRRGYATLSAVPFDGSFWNRRTTHRAYGYRRSLFAEDFAPGQTIGWGLNDRDFLTQTVARLAELPEPWCAYLLTLSLHHPFEGFPERLKVLDVGDLEGTPFGNFLHTMHFLDGALEDFVGELAQRGLLERTVLAVWGDHDAGFEWRPEIAAAMGFSADPRGWYLSQQVPFVVRVPGRAGPGRPIETPAGHVDVAPTLLALLGGDPSSCAWLGRNLLGNPGDGPVVGEYRCFEDAEHLYLRRGPTLADGECFDLGSMTAVPVGSCASGFEEARRQVEVSALVLEHDLQERLRRSLVGDLDETDAAP